MKFALLWIAIVAFGNARSALTPAGENVCLEHERYTVDVQVQEWVPVSIYTVQWCWNIPPRCTVETQTLKPITVTKKVPRMRIVPKCCRGYEEIAEESRCVPHCSESCINGDCIHPEICSCVSGYHGSRCDKPCEAGTWGRGCLEKCDCSGNGDCEGVNGICTCSAGWMGYRCEIPCDPGRFGINCEGRCNCDGDLCDHVSGDCAAITDATTTENAATTEEAVLAASTTETANVTDATETVAGFEITEVTEVITTETDVTPGEEVPSSTYPADAIPDVDNNTILVDEVPSTEPVEAPTNGPESPVGGTEFPVNETDADNEIDSTFDADVQRTKFNILNLLENLSIICGVLVLIFMLTMAVVLVSHHRKVKKIGIDCRVAYKNSQDFVAIHKFYGGCNNNTGKTIIDNQATRADMDLNVELPKLMTFKPLPDEKSDKLYFMKTNESREGNFDADPLSERIMDDYKNRLAQLGYDVPKSTSERFKYG